MYQLLQQAMNGVDRTGRTCIMPATHRFGRRHTVDRQFADSWEDALEAMNFKELRGQTPESGQPHIAPALKQIAAQNDQAGKGGGRGFFHASQIQHNRLRTGGHRLVR